MIAISTLFIYFCLFFFCLFRAELAAYGGSQARGQIGAIAAGLHHSHSNTRSKPRLRAAPQCTAMPDLNPLSEARHQTQVLVDTGSFLLSHDRNSRYTGLMFAFRRAEGGPEADISHSVGTSQVLQGDDSYGPLVFPYVWCILVSSFAWTFFFFFFFFPSVFLSF